MKIGSCYSTNGQCKFTVWAPSARQVALHLVTPEERSIPMQEESEGYWSLTVEKIAPDTQYFYQLNEQEKHPDPASQFQPLGVHGPSQIVDHQFAWSDPHWTGIPLDSLILYELHVGTFTPEGTFEAIIPRLKELRSLGINAIEIMPIAQFPGDPSVTQHPYRNWGYDGVYLYAVQNSYGGPTGLKKLVDACHQHEIAVFLDVVYNHFGPEGNYMSHFAPYFTKTYRTPWGDAINYDDAYSHHVRYFFLQNALYWLRDFHIDGLRLDAVQAIYDLGGKHFLKELTETVSEFSRQQNRPYHLIAESDLNDARIIRPFEVGGYGLDAQWCDDFHHALYALLTGETRGYYQDFGTCEHLAKAYRQSFVYDWQYAPHRKRFHGNSAEDCSPSQFVVCIQNHDQVANSFPGDRLSKIVSFDALKLAAANVILSPYIPLLFMGEEYGEEAPFTYFVSHSDPELIRMVRAGRQEEFAAFHVDRQVPDPEAVETFLMCQLNWSKQQEGKHQILWTFYQHLIQLRQTFPALMRRDRQFFQAFSNDENKTLTWHRWCEADHCLCLMNFQTSAVSFQPELPQGNWSKVLDSAESKWLGPGSNLPEHLSPETDITLHAQSFVLYRSSHPKAANR